METQAAAAMPHMPVGILVAYTGLIVFCLASLWKIFTKAGQPGWTALVPIYNFIVLLKVAQRPVWYFFLLFIPLVNIFAFCSAYNGLAKSFGKNAAFTLGLIFLGPVFFGLLAFGDAEYTPDNGSPSPMQSTGSHMKRVA